MFLYGTKIKSQTSARVPHSASSSSDGTSPRSRYSLANPSRLSTTSGGIVTLNIHLFITTVFGCLDELFDVWMYFFECLDELFDVWMYFFGCLDELFDVWMYFFDVWMNFLMFG
jgi:hypothetical protein